MNVEVEIKIKIKSFGKIRNELQKYGKLAKSIKQVDEYYTPRHRDFFARKPFPVEWLRIRTNPDETIFEYDKSIYKKGRKDMECAHEYETEISRPEELKKILNFLDFRKAVTVEKEREIWDCGDFEVSLDKVKKLGYFIEVEAKGNFKNSAEAKKACHAFLSKVGVRPTSEKIIKAGYPILLLEKRKFL